jgi:hypothetical protein
MKISEKLQACLDALTPSIQQSESTTKRRPLRLAMPVFLVCGAILGTLFVLPVLARGVQQTADTQETSAINPHAMEALNKMGAYLRTLKSFQVTAEVATDKVLEDGQSIEFNSKVDLVTARPNRMRVEITDDDGHRFLFFDGKNFTIFGAVVNYYATVPAPPTIPELVDNIRDKYDINLPLVDLFRWGTDDANIKKIKAAFDVGPSTVDGVTCEQYAFRQADVDWQIWIELGEFPLPRKIVIRTLTDDAKPQHREVLTWNLAPSFNENSFTFDPPANAHRIAIAEAKAAAAENKK